MYSEIAGVVSRQPKSKKGHENKNQDKQDLTCYNIKV